MTKEVLLIFVTPLLLLVLVSAINEEDYAEFNNMFDQYSCDSFLNYSFENPL